MLTAKNTLLSLITGCLFAGQGYDQVLRTAFAMPGLDPVAPGTPVPTGPALSKARARSGEHVARRAFELDAARAGAELGTGQLWHGMEVTAFDGTTAALDANDELDAAFGVPAGGRNPMLRLVALVRTATHRWAAAAIGGYHDGENALADQLESALAAGTLNLADRGFFSMDRFLRFSATGAQLCWRVKNGAKSVPVKTLETLPDGSELVMLHESDGMRARRRRDTGGKTAARLPDTIARLVQFTIVTRTRGGRARTSTIRLLTTLVDHEKHPAREIAVLYAERWQIEIAFLHLKKTLRGPRRVLRGKSETLARQEAWAFLLVHNMIATVAARAGALARIDPDLIPFTAVLGLVRAGLHADTRCGHCGRLPADPLGQSSTTLPPTPATALGECARQAGQQPNHAPGPPKKRLTPSPSHRQISHNGSKHPEVKGSDSYPQAKLADPQTILNHIGVPSYIWRFRERFAQDESPRDHEEEFIYAVNVGGLSDGIPEKHGSVSRRSNDTAVSANANCSGYTEVSSPPFPERFG